MAYFASPYNSDRAKAFRAAYAKAPMGQDFMFENQPYARSGPPGLLAEEGPGTATGYVEKPFIPESDRAYMSPAMLAEIAAKANRKRLGERIGGRSKVLRDRPVWDHFERRWVEPEGSFVQSPHGLDLLEQQNLIGNQTPSYLAQNRDSVQYQPGFQNIITGGRPQQGLLGPGYAGQNQTEGEGLRQQVAQGGSPQQSRIPANTDEHGWTKDRQMRDANLQVANMLLNLGEQSRYDGWDSPLTHD